MSRPWEPRNTHENPYYKCYDPSSPEFLNLKPEFRKCQGSETQEPSSVSELLALHFAQPPFYRPLCCLDSQFEFRVEGIWGSVPFCCFHFAPISVLSCSCKPPPQAYEIFHLGMIDIIQPKEKSHCASKDVGRCIPMCPTCLGRVPDTE